MALTKWLGIRLTDEQYAAMAKAADREKRKTADLGRLILVDWLRDRGDLPKEGAVGPESGSGTVS